MRVLRRSNPEASVRSSSVGGGLAQGYHGDQTLTDLKFPTLNDGRRVYRTGDLGRVQTDGVIEFLGRADDQVKVGRTQNRVGRD